MPIRESTNNRILPANARASDVASKAVQEFLAAEQSRNYSAFRVQGVEGLLYNRLMQGPKCTCQASERQLASRLDSEGKASPGLINQMLSGDLNFTITGSSYGANPKSQEYYNPLDALTSPQAPKNKNQGQFEVFALSDDEFLPSLVVDKQDLGDNGPVDPETLDDMVQDFDVGRMGMTDSHCHVCYGTGFVGGYVPFHAYRVVQPVNELDLGLAELDLLPRPWTASVTEVSTSIVLPRFVIGMDCLRLMNGGDLVRAQFKIDGQPCNLISLLRACDGRAHVISAVVDKPTTITHLELQLVTSDQSPYFELPKLTKGPDTAKLEQLEPFTILLSANVPSLRSEDIIVERMFGKTLYVIDSNWHNTRNRNVIGWECQVRVLQPQEIQTGLPKRGRTLSKPPTSLMQHDNMRGIRRT